MKESICPYNLRPHKVAEKVSLRRRRQLEFFLSLSKQEREKQRVTGPLSYYPKCVTHKNMKKPKSPTQQKVTLNVKLKFLPENFQLKVTHWHLHLLD
jgi:hypothetical protein